MLTPAFSIAGATSGRLRLKLVGQQDFFQVGFVPASGQAFVFDIDFCRRSLLKKVIAVWCSVL
jgi:hypothetical protein